MPQNGFLGKYKLMQQGGQKPKDVFGQCGMWS
jgi:hypothetical protein